MAGSELCDTRDGAAHRVAVFAPTFPPAVRGGGPVRSIDALVQTAPAGVEAYVLTPDTDWGGSVPLPVTQNSWEPLGDNHVRYVSARNPIYLLRGFWSLRAKKPSTLYFNSFFNPKFSILPLALAQVRLFGHAVRVLAPRGEFGEGALTRKQWKKRLYIGAFRLFGLQRGLIWHATADHEAADIRKMWGQDSIVVSRGNDTLLPAVAAVPVFHAGAVRAVFVGRIVEHKGLSIALAALRDAEVPLSLQIYGAEEDPGYAAECRRIAASLPSHVEVTFRGVIGHDLVRGALSESDVLLMPTAGENFAHVIAEALSVSCAVMTTPWTPWTARLHRGAGIVVEERTPLAWSEALEALVSDAGRLDRMRLQAGNEYNAWRNEDQAPHLFDMVRSVADAQ
jgi:glycosyltransferase involved in cell wall biosynthesis